MTKTYAPWADAPPEATRFFASKGTTVGYWFGPDCMIEFAEGVEVAPLNIPDSAYVSFASDPVLGSYFEEHRPEAEVLKGNEDLGGLPAIDPPIHPESIAQNPMQASIKGYRKFSEEESDLINRIKEAGPDIQQLLDDVAKVEGFDARFHSLAKTHFQTAAMYLIRAVARPDGLF